MASTDTGHKVSARCHVAATQDGSSLSRIVFGRQRRHIVTELTRRRGTSVQVSTTPAPGGGVLLPLALNDGDGALGNVAINVTLVIKVDLRAAEENPISV